MPFQALVQQVLVVDEGVNRQQLDARHAKVLDVFEQLVVGQAGEGAAQFFRHSRVAHADAAGMRFIDDRALPWDLHALVAAPGERRVDDLAFGHERRAVALVERQVTVGVADGVAEQCLGPFQAADQLLGIRVDQQFVGVEAVAVFRLVGAVHPVAIDQAGVSVGEVAMVDLIGVFGQLYALDFLLAGGVEQAQLDLGGVGREEGEVDPKAIPGGAEGEGHAFADARWCDRAGFLWGAGAHDDPRVAVMEGELCCPALASSRVNPLLHAPVMNL